MGRRHHRPDPPRVDADRGRPSATQLVAPRKGCPPWVGVAVALVVVYGILVGLTVALALSIAQFATILPDYQAKFDELVARGRELLDARGRRGRRSSGGAEHRRQPGFQRGFMVILDGTLSVFSGLAFVVTLLLFMAVDAVGYKRRFEILREERPISPRRSPRSPPAPGII